MGCFHIKVLNKVMQQVAFDDFVLASSLCESASLMPQNKRAASSLRHGAAACCGQ